MSGDRARLIRRRLLAGSLRVAAPAPAAEQVACQLLQELCGMGELQAKIGALPGLRRVAPTIGTAP